MADFFLFFKQLNLIVSNGDKQLSIFIVEMLYASNMSANLFWQVLISSAGSNDVRFCSGIHRDKILQSKLRLAITVTGSLRSLNFNSEVSSQTTSAQFRSANNLGTYEV